VRGASRPARPPGVCAGPHAGAAHFGDDLGRDVALAHEHQALEDGLGPVAAAGRGPTGLGAAQLDRLVADPHPARLPAARVEDVPGRHLRRQPELIRRLRLRGDDPPARPAHQGRRARAGSGGPSEWACLPVAAGISVSRKALLRVHSFERADSGPAQP
jgi:hypothetical protein